MIQSVFIMTATGEIIIEKHWRGKTNRQVCDTFFEKVTKAASYEDVPPILATSKYYLLNVYREGLFFIATVTAEMPPLFVLELLHRMVDIFVEYFGKVDDTVVKDNFATIYQLLEEMLDNGYPMTTEPNALKAMISPPTVIGRIAQTMSGKSGSVSEILPDGTISSMPWRKAGVKYTQNEVYFDIAEEVDAIVDDNGAVVLCECNGTIKCNSRLSGVPDLTLIFNDPDVIDDCAFHPCVRYNRFERDKVVSFVPPDGHFKLMNYRVDIKDLVSPVYCQSRLSYGTGELNGSMSIMVGMKNQSQWGLRFTGKKVVVEDVSIRIPFPKAIKTINITPTVGKAIFDESTKTITWTIGKITERTKSANLTGTIYTNNTADRAKMEKPTIQFNWKVPLSTVSGIGVDQLMLTNERYRPFKGVRTVTQTGNYQIRTS